MLQDSSQSAGMFGVGNAGMAFTAGPLSANPVETLNSSPSMHSNIGRSPSGNLLKSDTATLATSGSSSSYDKCSNSSSHSTEPTCIPRPAGRMITQTSNVSIPRSAKYYDLAWFLKHTGPEGIYDSPKRADSTSKSAFRFFKKAPKGSPGTSAVLSSKTDRDRDMDKILLFDEGGLLPGKRLPEGVEQKRTLTGTPYLAVTVDCSKRLKLEHDYQSTLDKKELPKLKLDSSLATPINIAERHASDISTLTASHEWLLKYSGREPSPVSPISSHESSKIPPQPHSTATLPIDTTHSPIRPAASNPPTPPPDSATTIAEAYKCDLTEHPAKFSVDLTCLVSRRSKNVSRKPVTPMPTLVLRDEEFPVNVPRPGRECDMQHPSPRRLASHPLLQHRESTLVEAALPRSATQSPGTPPAKSPLRIRRDQRTVSIERGVETNDGGHASPQKTSPIIQTPEEFAQRHLTVVPSVTTECTGPLTRNTSQTRSPVKNMLYPASRKEREERIRARKVRDKPQSMSHTIDTVVCDIPPTTRQRLRKPRAQITTPEISSLRPAPLIIGLSNTTPQASMECSSSSKPRATLARQGEVTPHHSRGSSVTTADTPASLSVTDSPYGGKVDMLLAEELPLHTRLPVRPARIVVAKERVYTPRPRSASMPRGTPKRRSRNSVSMPTRVLTPEMPKDRSTTPPLPSPPPNRALPPTPPASGSEKVKKKVSRNPYTTPLMTSTQNWPHPPASSKARNHTPGHNGSQPTSEPPQDAVQLHARLAYLEKHNKMLSAALMAVLSTNGESNMPLTSLIENSPKYAMTWEDRVTRRSEASHAASSSNGSALDFYLSTKRGSKVGQ